MISARLLPEFALSDIYKANRWILLENFFNESYLVQVII